MNPLNIEINGKVALLTIQRPKAMNSLNEDVMKSLDHFFTHEYKEHDIRAIIITGEGKAFVAGADITQFKELDRGGGEAFSRSGNAIFHQIEEMNIPVIAAINGFALGGGCELAMSCHIRIASEKARFGQPEINLGIIPGYGGTQRLPSIIGKSKALYYMLTAEMMTAAEALKLELVDEVVPADALMPRAREVAEKIASFSPLIVEKIMRSVRAGHSSGHDGFDTEADLFGSCFETEDMQEGVSAFLEKRKPEFKGK